MLSATTHKLRKILEALQELPAAEEFIEEYAT